MKNNNNETHLIDAHEEHIREDAKEVESFEDMNENTLYEEAFKKNSHILTL